MLGTVEAGDGAPVALGDRQRAVLAALLARAGEVVSFDRLVDLVWGERPPANPHAALHSQVSRLRRALGYDGLVTRPPGYLLQAGPGEVDALRFDALVAEARRQDDPAAAAALLGEALALWRGPAYAEFADAEIARLEAIRLDEARLEAVEARAAALLDCGRAAEALPALEAFTTEHPLRERARALLMRALYALGRHADALRNYQAYRRRLAEDLGLEPSAAMAALELEILRHDVAPQALPVVLHAPPVAAQAPPAAGHAGRAGPPLSALRARYAADANGRTIAYATLGEGPPLVALPGWVSAIDVIASGRDPRSSLLQRLVAHVRLTLYDRYGTGLSRGPVHDFSLEPSVAELAAVVERTGGPVSLLAMSQAGPVALAFAARHPELVERLVMFGTYASGPAVFTHTELNAMLVRMIRTHWGIGSRLMADLYRPGGSDAAARHMAGVLKDSADRETAAGYLEAIYDIDVADLLPEIAAPALVLHYTGDRVIPFAGGRHLAAELPDAHLIALDGPYHLPDAAHLDRVTDAIAGFLTEGR
ncbi:hypothetical protein GCM10023259_090070 [Thermocatellispora tengchongensis]